MFETFLIGAGMIFGAVLLGIYMQWKELQAINARPLHDPYGHLDPEVVAKLRETVKKITVDLTYEDRVM